MAFPGGFVGVLAFLSFFSCSQNHSEINPCTVFRTSLHVDPVTLDPQQIFDAVSDRVARQIRTTDAILYYTNPANSSTIRLTMLRTKSAEPRG